MEVVITSDRWHKKSGRVVHSLSSSIAAVMLSLSLFCSDCDKGDDVNYYLTVIKCFLIIDEGRRHCYVLFLSPQRNYYLMMMNVN